MNLKSNKVSMLFVIMVSMIMIGASNRLLTYCAIPAIIVLAISVCIEAKKENGVLVCKGILALLLLQNFCIGISAHLFGNTDSSIKLLTQIPFLVILVIWIFKCVANHNRNISFRVKVSFVLLIGCIMLSFCIGFGGFMSAAVSVRNLTVFFMAYELGAEYIEDKKNREELIKYIIIWAIVLIILGIIIKLGGYPLYRALGIHEVYVAKAAPFNEGGLDGRFYTSLFSNISYIRMGSIMYEPINLAYFLALALICAIYSNPWVGVKKMVSMVFIGMGLLLTFGKGGYLIVGLTVVCGVAEYFLKKITHIVGKTVTAVTVIIMIITVTVVFIRYYVANIGLAVLNHIWGIINTWKNIINRPIGYGLGTGGNAAQVLGNVQGEWLATGGETALMSFMYQIGVQGIVVFIVCLSFIAFDMKNRKSTFERIFFYIPFILLGISLLQDNTFTPQCVVPFMLIQGSLCNIKSQKTEVINQRCLSNENEDNSNVLATVS